MSKKIIKNGQIINRGRIVEGDLLIEDDRICKVGGTIDVPGEEIDATGCWVMPGIIDDQVHFREPGLTHKAEIETESKAAVAGGVTTFMEMPNTKPPTINQEALQAKYDRAAKISYSNYSFFMGATNDNLEEVLKTNPKNVCGIKIFMGSSTGNMLVDNRIALENLFKEVPMLIATHCEDEETIRKNMAFYKEEFGDELDATYHPIIRNMTGCLISSSLAVDLAKNFGTRLHILHISTGDEVELFTNDIPLMEKKITSEACVHHLYFNSGDYPEMGNKIKCNPAIKEDFHQEAIFQGLLDNKIDIIATDHAPHTWEEKLQHFLKAPSGLPLVQHSINVMLDFYHRGMITAERLVEKMCHAPADCFRVEERGYLDEGSFADIAIVDPDADFKIEKSNILYKCGWSPLEGKTMKGKVKNTLVNGVEVYNANQEFKQAQGRRVTFY